MIKCTQTRETNAAGHPSLQSDALIKSRGVAPAIRKKIGGPSNPNDLNARHRRVNTIDSPPVASRESRKNRDPVNQSSTPACKQGSQYVAEHEGNRNDILAATTCVYSSLTIPASRPAAAAFIAARISVRERENTDGAR